MYWRSEGLEDTSPVRDLSVGGLFLETGETRALGTTINLEFLVQEGAIRAAGVVRHAEPGRGMELKFTSVRGKDLQHLVELVNRSSAHSSFRSSMALSAMPAVQTAPSRRRRAG